MKLELVAVVDGVSNQRGGEALVEQPTGCGRRELGVHPLELGRRNAPASAPRVLPREADFQWLVNQDGKRGQAAGEGERRQAPFGGGVRAVEDCPQPGRAASGDPGVGFGDDFGIAGLVSGIAGEFAAQRVEGDHNIVGPAASGQGRLPGAGLAEHDQQAGGRKCR